jgi:sulfur-carrier protein
MAVVKLRSPLRELADGSEELTIDGSTLGEVIAKLQGSYPKLTGWVTDEQGSVRRHVTLFLNGERAGLEAKVQPADRIHVLPAISGGAVGLAERTELQSIAPEVAEDAELLVGTRKGLFVLRGPRGGPMEEVARKFSGSTVEFAVRDPRSGTYFASVTHGQFGPRLYASADPLGEWEQADGPAFPEDAGSAVERIWFVRTG